MRLGICLFLAYYFFDGLTNGTLLPIPRLTPLRASTVMCQQDFGRCTMGEGTSSTFTTEYHVPCQDLSFVAEWMVAFPW